VSAPDLRPLDREPVSVRPPYDVRRPCTGDRAADRADYLSALLEPIAGLPLGAYDERIIRWLGGWDLPTVGTVASLLHRARAATPLDEGGAQ
jgi:hypothetical protein